MRWFTQGDRNTKFFHSYVRGKRKNLQIRDIKNDHGVNLTKDLEIGLEAVRVLQEQFIEDTFCFDYSMLDIVSPLITQEKNEIMTALRTMEEVKKVVFQLNGASTAGPVILLVCFFRHTGRWFHRMSLMW